MEEYERRLRWHCRRGLLELDITLERFLDRELSRLTPADRDVLEQLLMIDDIQLWAWVSGREVCEDPQQAEMIRCIMSSTQAA